MNDKTSIKVFIGSSRSEWLPAKVLEHSIKSRSHHNIEVVRLYESPITIPTPKRKECAPRTPFSFQRFLIPELCGYQGRAIYLDADMLVFADITALWNMSMDGNAVLSVAPENHAQAPQFSVILLDTEKLLWNINDIINGLDSKKFTYHQLMQDFVIAKNVALKIPSVWNSLEHFNNSTKLLHYTDMTQQPWVSLKNPLKNLWVNELKEAVLTGSITVGEIETEIQLGYIRPSLKRELDYALNNSEPPEIAQLEHIDRTFSAPYKKLRLSLLHAVKNKLQAFLPGKNQ